MSVLNAGKGLYIENPDLGFAHSGTLLYQMLGATYLGDGYGYTTGNVSSVTGQPGTFVAGMTYNYMYQQLPDNYVDYIGSNGGTILFKSQEGYGRVICYSGPSNSYRSIYSTFNFGALRNGVNTKLQLLVKYMEYLMPIGIEESSETSLSDFSYIPNPASKYVTFSFTLSATQNVCIEIFNTAGQKVKTLVNKDLGKGIHQFNWNLTDNNRRFVANGVYLCRISAGENTITRTVILAR